MGEPARFHLKVRHYEVDAYGHVNHANYVHFLEVARLEALEGLGLSLQEMRRQGYLIVAADLSVKFHAPAFPGEVLEILTQIRELGNVRSVWVQEVREVVSRRLVVTAEVTGVFVAENGRPVPIPSLFHSRLVSLYAPDAAAANRAQNKRSP